MADGRRVSLGDNALENRYVITDVDERTVGILASFPGPSLRARFGDYRPSPENRIGVGDEVRVTDMGSGFGRLCSPRLSSASSQLAPAAP